MFARLVRDTGPYLRVVSLVILPSLAIAGLLAAGFIACRAVHAPHLPPLLGLVTASALAGTAAAFVVVVVTLIVTREGGKVPDPPPPPMKTGPSS